MPEEPTTRATRVNKANASKALVMQDALSIGSAQQLRIIADKLKWLVVAAIFAFCVAPTFISYESYLFEWDDSVYLAQSIAVSRAFWSTDLHGLTGLGIGIRPPAMALLGLPWGPLASWDDAGKCFITLAAAISLLAASCLYLLLRIGVKPFFVATASVCVFASLGPYPPTPFADRGAAHSSATAFMVDSLFAWTVLAALLLIPYEARTHCTSTRGAVLRGILWGTILSLGVMMKVNFLYFIVLIVPTLLLIRLCNGGLRSTLVALISLAFWSAPSAFYLVRWGRHIFDNAKTSSFGEVAAFYYIPLWQFLDNSIRESPGLVFSFVLMAMALLYLVFKKRIIPWGPDFLALLIAIGFGVIVLAAPNRQIRYAFPVIVALPFLCAVLMSGRERLAPCRAAVLTVGLVFCGLVAAGVPTGHRANNQSIGRSNAVLAQAAACNVKHILLATDSPTLNRELLVLAIEVSGSHTSVETDRVSTLASHAMLGTPIEDDFHAIGEADQVVFQDRNALSPPFTNQRVSEYEQYIRQAGYVPIKVGDDLSVYSIRCRP